MSVYSALAYKNKRLSDFHHRLCLPMGVPREDGGRRVACSYRQDARRL